MPLKVDWKVPLEIHDDFRDVDFYCAIVCPYRRGGAASIEVPAPRDFYLKLFKPRGVICTHRNERYSEKGIVSQLYPRGTEEVVFIWLLSLLVD